MASDRLTALDASFLHLEDATSHMHVASVTIFEGPPPTHAELLEHVERRLSLVPRFRQKLRFVPLGQGRPVWVDDPHFNLEYHVRCHRAAAAGQRAAAQVPGQPRVRAAARPHEAAVGDLARPGPRGLGRGDPRVAARARFALLSKTHHCLVDGVAGVDITAVLFDTAAEPEPARPGRRGSRSPSRPPRSFSGTR